jgi:predicted DNA-binding protein (MmcQ/YjbR family)
MADSGLERLREVCLAFPEATEKLTWEDSHTFRVRNKIFAMTGNDKKDGRIGIWCKAEPGAQEVLVGAEPDRFFIPPYTGRNGWIGIYLDDGTDWGAAGALVGDSYRLVAPKKLAALLDT